MANKVRSYNIKDDMPDRVEAGRRLAEILRISKGKEKVIKIIHGYGSSGVGGVIKQTVHKALRTKLNEKAIKAYIPGEAIYRMMGFDDVVHTYAHLIKHDSDYKKGNDGITYIIF
ncbi:hypothetical protein RJI07_01055 [Mycoplasmatota bacterium WC30]